MSPAWSTSRTITPRPSPRCAFTSTAQGDPARALHRRHLRHRQDRHQRQQTRGLPRRQGRVRHHRPLAAEPRRQNLADIGDLLHPDRQRRPRCPCPRVAQIEPAPASAPSATSTRSASSPSPPTPSAATATTVLTDVQSRLAGLDLPAGYTIDFTGEQEEQEKAAAFLGKAFVAALFLIVLVLVTQFNSLRADR